MKTTSRLLPLVIACTTMLTACGGGGGGLSTATKTPTVAGTISGLGSIILNGVRYETIGASLVDADDGTTISSPMGMGMTVTVDPSTTGSTVAGTIHIQTGIKGNTSLVNTSTSTLNVAGLPVITDSSTFIVNSATSTSGSFASLLANNQNVEVYGLPQSDGTFKATRIEILATAPMVQLVGTVFGLNTANSTFTLGGNGSTVTVTYSSASAPTGLANGAVVSVHTSTSATAANYTATSLYLRSTNTSTFTQYATNYSGTSGISNETNELYGMVSNLALTSSGCSLQVQGVSSTLSSATLCNALQNGDYVELKGQFLNGQLTAHRVEFKTSGGDRSLASYQDDSQDSDHDQLKYSRRLSTTTSSSSSSSSTESSSSYEIYGTLSNCSSATANNCTLTSNGVAYTADLSSAFWEHGMVTSGWVEAKGYMATNSTFKVTKIESK